MCTVMPRQPQSEPPPEESVLLTATLTVSSSSPAVEVSLSTPNALYLLSDLASQLGLGDLGINVPAVGACEP